ncbi:MAG: HAMP domain-containing histidine kinase [Gammaproteobacteria bacterium]|nr:HAMP domain-containing histidine kinase [Gammaproteobacteria bacterium]MDH5801811.1 HAMP domain-containing histidine kinase [Gammaproteobacteria bacterium]
MSPFAQSKYEFGQTGWHQSIAVNITAQIIWIIVPIVFICSIILFFTLDNYHSEIFSYKLDALNHRVANVLYNKTNLSEIDKGDIINKVAEDLGFVAIEVEAPNYHLQSRIPTDTFVSLTRTLDFGNRTDQFENSLVSITSYHQPQHKELLRQKKDILFFVLSVLVVFSIFLVVSIRKWLYKPLKSLVEATESIASGKTDVCLDTDRKDEFGHLAEFFNLMVINMNQQHQRLWEAAQEAKTANRAKSDFLATMSHELRTPLNAIIGYSEIMLEQAVDRGDQGYTEDLQKIAGSGRNLLSLINELLDLSKIEAGKMVVHLEHFDLEGLLEELEFTFIPLARQNNNRLLIENSAGAVEMNSDLTKVRQILINLLGNACKFTKNGTITVQLLKQTKNGINCVVVCISDTGIGMDSSNIQRMFDPFVQEDNTLTRKYNGTGLGLSICRRLTELLGGEISVESVKGQGTRFTVILPSSLGEFCPVVAPIRVGLSE